MSSDVQSIYNYRGVDDSLATSGQPTEGQIAALAEAGFEVVINLGLHGDPRYSLPDESGVVRSLGMQYVHIPVQFNAPSEADLLAFFDAMDTHARQKRFVHCAANKRVTAFLGLYQLIRKHNDRDSAFALMRSVWTPDETWSRFIEEMVDRHGG